MGLTERGNSAPDNWDQSRNDSLADKFGIDPEELPQSIEEAYQMVEARMGSGMVEALKIMLSAVHKAEQIEAYGETEEAVLEYYELLDTLTEFPKEIVRNIIGSGIMATVVVRKMDKE